jgi:uncharacterized protein (TIRG00374 family)
LGLSNYILFNVAWEDGLLMSQEEKPLSLQNLLSGWRYQMLILTIVLSIAGYLLFTLWGGWQEVVDSLAVVGYIGVIVGLALALMNYFLRFLRWQYYLNLIGHSIPFFNSLRIYIAGFALTTTPGKAGEALRSVFLKQYGVSYRKSVGILVAERFSDLLALLVLTMIGIGTYASAIPLVLSVFLLAGLAVLFSQQTRWHDAIRSLSQRKCSDRIAKMVSTLLDLIDSFRLCFAFVPFVNGLVLSIISWSTEGFAFYYFLHLLGSDISLASAFFVYGFSMILGALSFLPGGLGGTELVMLQLLMWYGVDDGVAVAVTIVFRLVTLWFSVVLGLFALPKLRQSSQSPL